MHPEEGLIASVEPGVSMTKLSELNGAVSGTKPVNTKSGFEGLFASLHQCVVYCVLIS